MCDRFNRVTLYFMSSWNVSQFYWILKWFRHEMGGKKNVTRVTRAKKNEKWMRKSDSSSRLFRISSYSMLRLWRPSPCCGFIILDDTWRKFEVWISFANLSFFLLSFSSVTCRSTQNTAMNLRWNVSNGSKRSPASQSTLLETWTTSLRLWRMAFFSVN